MERRALKIGVALVANFTYRDHDADAGSDAFGLRRCVCQDFSYT